MLAGWKFQAFKSNCFGIWYKQQLQLKPLYGYTLAIFKGFANAWMFNYFVHVPVNRNVKLYKTNNIQL